MKSLISFPNTELSVDSIIFTIILISSLIGFMWIITKWASSAPLYRKVDYEATPEKLILNTTYYLNGETPATFLRQDDSGNYLFKIEPLICSIFASSFLTKVMEKSDTPNINGPLKRMEATKPIKGTDCINIIIR